MGTHTHVHATVLLAAALAGGCIFGGGKKKPEAVKVTRPPAAAEQAVATAPRVNSKLQSAKRADAEVEKFLQPKEPGVKWIDPEALRLGNAAPTRPVPRPQPQPSPDPVQPEPAPAPVVALQPQPQPRAVAPEASAQVIPQPAPEETSPRAVANQPFAVAGNDTPAPPAAATPDAAALQQPMLASAATGAAAPAGEADELARRVAKRLRDNPGDLAAHLDHQLLRFLLDESVPDLNTLSTLPGEDRELLTALLDGLTNFRNELRVDGNMLLSRKVRPLLDLSARLRSQAELSIPTIALCDKVDAFGVYVPRENRFVAKKAANETLVYCEVANVSSQQSQDGWWDSKLSQEAVLYTEKGVRVWANSRMITPDRSRNRRNDFFVCQRISLLPTLPVDQYILKVTVTDEQVKRVAEATIPIQIVAGLGTPPATVGSPIAAPAPAPTAAPASPAPNIPAATPAPVAGGVDARTAGSRQPAAIGTPLLRRGRPAEGK